MSSLIRHWHCATSYTLFNFLGFFCIGFGYQRRRFSAYFGGFFSLRFLTTHVRHLGTLDFYSALPQSSSTPPSTEIHLLDTLKKCLFCFYA